MREIKFRAWDDQIGMFPVELMTFPFVHEDGEMSALNLNAVCTQIDKHIEQFTGLKDKNGKEIYEGDVVEYGKVHRGEVKWEKDGFVADIRDKHSGLRCYYKWEALEVIGNIHETPDLLESGETTTAK